MRKWSDQVAALEQAVEVASSQLQAAQQALHRQMVAESGIAVGDIVRHRGRLFRVAKVEPHFWGVWLLANPRKKDGTFGIALRHIIGPWEKVEA